MSKGESFATGFVIGLFSSTIVHFIIVCYQHNCRKCNHVAMTAGNVIKGFKNIRGDWGDEIYYFLTYKYYDFNPQHTSFFMKKLIDKYLVNTNVPNDIYQMLIDCIGDSFVFYIGPFKDTKQTNREVYNEVVEHERSYTYKNSDIWIKYNLDDPKYSTIKGRYDEYQRLYTTRVLGCSNETSFIWWGCIILVLCGTALYFGLKQYSPLTSSDVIIMVIIPMILTIIYTIVVVRYYGLLCFRNTKISSLRSKMENIYVMTQLEYDQRQRFKSTIEPV